jgi:hypothetical protein
MVVQNVVCNFQFIYWQRKIALTEYIFCRSIYKGSNRLKERNVIMWGRKQETRKLNWPSEEAIKSEVPTSAVSGASGGTVVCFNWKCVRDIGWKF